MANPAQEIKHLTGSFAQLKQAQVKFKTCIENVREVKPQNKGGISELHAAHLAHMNLQDKTILVPLTNSLYVPGKLSNPDYVIVDVGTGYFIQKVCTTVPPLVAHLIRLHLEPGPGREILHREGRFHSKKPGYLGGNDIEETGEYDILDQRITVQDSGSNATDIVTELIGAKLVYGNP